MLTIASKSKPYNVTSAMGLSTLQQLDLETSVNLSKISQPSKFDFYFKTFPIAFILPVVPQSAFFLRHPPGPPSDISQPNQLSPFSPNQQKESHSYPKFIHFLS